MRATGVSLLYNFSVMLFGGLAAFFITAIIKVTGGPMASAFYVTGGVVEAILITTRPDPHRTKHPRQNRG